MTTESRVGVGIINGTEPTGIPVDGFVDFFCGNEELAENVQRFIGIQQSRNPISRPNRKAAEDAYLRRIAFKLITGDTIAMELDETEYAERDFYRRHVVRKVSTGDSALDGVFRKVGIFMRTTGDFDLKEELAVYRDSWKDFHRDTPFNPRRNHEQQTQ